VRRVLLFPGALGDLCLLAPSIAAIAARGDRVELCVQRALAPVVRMLLPMVEVGPPMDGAAMSSMFGDAVDASLASRLRAADRLDAWLARGDVDGAVSRCFVRLGVSFSLHEVPRGDGRRHASADYAEALGIAPVVGAPRAVAPAPGRPLPWRRSGRARLLLHPGAGAPVKAWAFEGFRRIADDWESAGGEAVVLLGPAEDAQVDAWRLVGRTVVAGLAITDAAAVMASATHWIGNDSGMSHLAGALDRAGVVLFTVTRAARWHPLGGRLRAIEVAGRAHDAVTREVCMRLRALEPAACLDTPRPRH
jgi:hypothetical protein